MRLTIYLSFICIVQVTASAYSQGENVTINAQTKSVKEIFDEIQEKSNYRFFYSDDLIDLNKEIYVAFKNQPVEHVLSDISSKSGLQYKILEDNLIVISPAEVMQARTIQGRITSMMDGAGIPGANVVVKDSGTGTITDINGEYTIEIDGEGAVLVFSYVGYMTEEVEVGNRSVIDVVLAESIESLEEIVVTGLSIERDRESLGYSVSQVDGDQVNLVKADNFANALAGKVAGLQITESATGVGGSSRVVLRGVSSMLGNNRPLFVIDGIPMLSNFNSGNNPNKDGGDALADINPEDIESVSVLKGAGAAAVYGSRGANGVILITTKKGALNKGIGVSFNSTYTREDPLVFPDLQNEYGQGGLFGRYPITDPNRTVLDHPNIWSYGPKMDSTMRIDWTGKRSPYVSPEDQFKYFFRTGNSFINNLSLEAGNENSSLRVSLTDQRSSGISPGNDLSRQTFSARGFTKLKDIFEVDAKVTYIHHNVKNRPVLRENGANSALSLSILPRNISAQSLEENTTDEFGNEMTWLLDETFGNPYWMLENQGNNDIKDRYQTALSIKTNITDNLYLLLRSGLDQYSLEDKNWVNRGTNTSERGRGSYNHTISKNTEWNSDFLLTYEDGAGDISYGVSLGGNYRADKYNNIDQRGSGYQIPGYYHISNMSEYYTEEYSSRKEVASLYALGNVSFDDDLYVDLTYRSDWSSSLPLDNNQFNYYSANVSWLLTNTFELPEFFSSGKIRGSVAQTGNDTDAYQLENVYSVVQSQLPYSMVSIPNRLLTPDLLPEITNTWEIGTDLGFFGNRLIFDFTYYYSLAKNQIMPVPIPKSTAYSEKRLNSGELENRGIELMLNATVLNRPAGLTWNSILTYTRNKSYVKSIHPDLESIILNDAWDASIQAIPGEEYGQIFGYDYKRDAQGRMLIDDNGFPQQGELKAHGSINPDYIFGFQNSFSYKNFTLSFLIDGTMGAEIYSWGKTYKMLWGTDVETLEGRAEWFETHDENGFPIPGVEPKGYVFEGIVESSGEPNTTPIPDPAYRGYIPYNYKIITESVLDASNIRLREAVLSYNFPRALISRIKLTNLTLSATGRNLFFFYRPTDHIDPEAGYSSGNTGNGMEQSSMPSTRSIGFNLRLSF
ncbi:MAG: SusC/RagA family TonB-linked outer membrane protein [Cytophagales bacterium]|nr:SusC/RagA family TonB-linked outer membrane protein [Cytophagales bacterium]